MPAMGSAGQGQQLLAQPAHRSPGLQALQGQAEDGLQLAPFKPTPLVLETQAGRRARLEKPVPAGPSLWPSALPPEGFRQPESREQPGSEAGQEKLFHLCQPWGPHMAESGAPEQPLPSGTQDGG